MKVRRSIWIGAALVIAVAIILVVIINAQNKAITFKDPNFEAMVRAQIGKPSGDIHEDAIENIRVLIVSSNISGNTTDYGAIKDLIDLKHFTGLEALLITDAEVNDLSPLSSLSKLQHVSFSGCNITADLSTLSDLPSLQGLAISASQVSDLSPISNLTRLRELYLTNPGGVGLSDLSMFSHLTNLTSLNLSGNKIQDISLLSNRTQLTDLDISYNEVRDISPLSSLTNLTGLRLDSNQISDITPLSKLTNLTTLDLSDNQISDVAPLSQLTNLTTLGLSDNQISDVSQLMQNGRDGHGVTIKLYNNPLSEESFNVYLPQLSARGYIIQL
jgi:internalin A